MDTPTIADFPGEMDRLAEWRRRRAAEEQRLLGESEGVGGLALYGGDRDPSPDAR